MTVRNNNLAFKKNSHENFLNTEIYNCRLMKIMF